MNAAPELSWRALRVLDDDQVRHDQRHEQRERRSQLAEPRAQQQLDAATSAARVSMLAASASRRSAATRSRRSSAVASGTTINTTTPMPRAFDDGIAHGEQRADGDELRRAAEKLWAARRSSAAG